MNTKTKIHQYDSCKRFTLAFKTETKKERKNLFEANGNHKEEVAIVNITQTLKIIKRDKGVNTSRGCNNSNYINQKLTTKQRNKEQQWTDHPNR